MKSTIASINMEVMCDCPHCGEHINIMSDLEGQCINIFEYACNSIEVDVKCPECKAYFEVKLEY